MADRNSFSKSERIGFIGLGWMGSNFARRLCEAGWRMDVFDIDPERTAPLLSLGARLAGSAEALAGDCDLVMLSLPNSDVLESVAQEKMVPNARVGQVFVDLGTSRLGPTRALAGLLAQKGAALLDAPVSGDPRRPVYMFVGGKKTALDRVRPVLECLAAPEHLSYGGESGAGQILKGVNQLAMGLVQAAWLETVGFATRQGVDAETVASAVGGEDGWRQTLAQTARMVAEGRGEAQDLKFAEWPYFLHAAEASGIPLPLTEALQSFCKDGPRDWRDNMHRPYVSFWHMLNEQKASTPE